MTSERLTVGGLAAALDARFPVTWAESWDRVGLVIGGSETPVSGIHVTLDATSEGVNRAAAEGANVLVTHHPPFLEMPGRVSRTAGPAGTLEAAVREGVAVISMHTNLDRSPEGASALPKLLGLNCERPLESGTEPVSLIVVYAPPTYEAILRSAMADAGAGRLGQYSDCAFVASGTGHFTPGPGASPAVVAASEGADEVRIEMTAPPMFADGIVEAARAAHPYEEPVILRLDGARARGMARLGRVCTWQAGATVAGLAAHVAQALDVRPRVWGPGERTVTRIAVANGSAGSLVGRAGALADVLIAGEVRYHDALDAVASGLAVIEAGHDVTEWPLIDVLVNAVTEAADGVRITRDAPAAGWWTIGDYDDRS